MVIKLGTLANSQETLLKLKNTEGFDSVTAYRILKNIRTITDELREYEIQKKHLVQKYAEKDEHGKLVISDGHCKVKGEDIGFYTEEMSNLQNETVDIDLKMLDIESLNPAGLSPRQIETIEYMLIEK